MMSLGNNNDSKNAARGSSFLVPLLVLFVIGLLVSIFILFKFYLVTQSNSVEIPQKDTVGSLSIATPQEMNLSGKIYFNDNDVETRRSYLRVYDVSTETFTDTAVDENGYDQNPVFFRDSAGTEELIYLHAKFDQHTANKYPISGPRSIISSYLKTGESKVISTKEIPLRRQLSVAQDVKNIASAGVSSEFEGDPYNDDVELSDYSVYVLLEGQEEEIEIGAGFWPSWSADGRRLYFVRSDGIYCYDIETENIDFLFGKNTWSLNLLTSGVISPNEVFFVGYDPGPREINVYRLVPGKSSVRFVYDATYPTFNNEQFFTPSFSTDGDVLFYTSAPNNWEKASVIAVDLVNKKQSKVFEVPLAGQPYGLFPYYSK